MKKLFATIAVVALSALLVVGYTTQAQDQDEQGRYRVPEYEKNIAVNYMLVDVIVTDRQGNYVRNLDKEDFEVFEDGKKVEIVSLDEYSMLPTPEETPGTLEDMAGGDLVRQQPPRNIILFVDLFYSSSYGITRAINVAQDFVIDRIQPGDRVMVVSYFNSMRVVQPFTNDKQEVIRALEESGLGADGRTARAQAVSGNSVVSRPGISDQVVVEQELGNSILEEQTERRYSQQNTLNYIRSMKALSDVVKELPGRKTLVMLSEGIDFNLIDPTELNDDNFGPNARQQGTQASSGGITGTIPPPPPSPQSMMSLVPEYRDMVEDLNDAKVSMYTVNVGGLEAPGNASDRFSPQDGDIPGQGMRPGVESIRDRQEFLSGIASDTGGRAYFNTNNIRNLLNAIEVDISNYYILGYRTEVDTDKAEYRNIDVRVKEGNTNVLHRRGFRTPVPFEAMDSEERDLHLVRGLEQGLQLNELRALAQTSFLSTTVDDVRAAVSVSIPTENLEANRKDEYDISVLISNLDAEGTIFSSTHRRLVVENARNPELQEQGIRFVEGVDADFGVNKIRIALRDNITGKRSYFYFNQIFRTPPEDTLLVASPVFIDEEHMMRVEDQFDVRWVDEDKWNDDTPAGTDMLRHPEAGKIFPAIVPSYSGDEPVSFFVTVHNFQRTDVQAEEVEFVCAVAPRPNNPNEKRNWLVISQMDQSQVYALPGGMGMAFAGTFTVGALDPGVYDFLVQVTDKTSERKNFGITRLLVKGQ